MVKKKQVIQMGIQFIRAQIKEPNIWGGHHRRINYKSMFQQCTKCGRDRFCRCHKWTRSRTLKGAVQLVEFVDADWASDMLDRKSPTLVSVL